MKSHYNPKKGNVTRKLHYSSHVSLNPKMNWTYGQYVGMNVGIGIGLVLITFLAVILTTWSLDVKSFFIRVVIGIDLNDIDDIDGETTEQHSSRHSIHENNSSHVVEQNKHINVYDEKLKKNDKRLTCLSRSFVCMCAGILAIMPVLILDGCVLGSIGLSDGDNCPDDPMDCFVFDQYETNSPSSSFQCMPGNLANFSATLPGGYSWCYGWIIKRQTTKRVLDQLGVCTGLMGLFATIFALFVYVSKKKIMQSLIPGI